MMNLKPQIKESSECMRMIREFAGTLSDGNQVDKDVSAVLFKRMSHVTSAGKEDSPMSGRKRSNSMYNGMKSIKFDIIEDTARDIAEQFTLVSFESFKRIPMDVLIKKRFEKQTDATETPLGRFVNFFNDSSRWICTQIVMAASEERPQRIAKFIMIMRELWSLSNFNGVMIFFSALNNGAITKLMDRIVPNLPQEVIQSFEEVRNLMDHRLNFKNYREDLESAPAPCIPYIALILRDLMHLEELETIEEDGRVNWHKLSSIGKILYKFSHYQTASYEFEAIPHIQRYFVNFQRSTILNESELYELGRVVSNVSSSSSIDMSKSSTSIDSDPPEEDVESSEEECEFDEKTDVLQAEGLYVLPPWVLKREVTTSLGNLIEFNSVVAKKTVLFVFLRHFGCIICRKSAAELMMIKPHLDRLGVKLVAVSTGTPAQAKAFKEEFKFDGEIYVDEARHLYDDFRCQRGWIKGVLNPKTQAMNAEARALGYAQGPIQGDILQLGGAFILKNGNVMYEHIEKYAGDIADPVDILKRLGASKDTIERVYNSHPQLRPKLKQMRQKIRSLESKRKKIIKKLRRLSDKTPELLKTDTSSSTLNRRRWSEKLISLNKRKSLEIDLDKDKEDLIKKRHKYNQIKEKEMILELKIEKCRNKQLMLAHDSKEGNL
jgi:alkyl hydroperoxide reductase subunit AhpC